MTMDKFDIGGDMGRGGGKSDTGGEGRKGVGVGGGGELGVMVHKSVKSEVR